MILARWPATFRRDVFREVTHICSPDLGMTLLFFLDDFEIVTDISQ